MKVFLLTYLSGHKTLDSGNTNCARIMVQSEINFVGSAAAQKIVYSSNLYGLIQHNWQNCSQSPQH